MSRIFLDQLEIPEPIYHLDIRSGSHGNMTGRMLMKLEEVLLFEQPDWVLVYGDTNSTLAGALAASKIQIPIAHVEAGLRSFNRRMPEEINRILADHASQVLFAPTETAVSNLEREGLSDKTFKVGDVMLDVHMHCTAKARACSKILRDLSLESGDYYLATVHRQENTDDPSRLSGILDALAAISAYGRPVVVPLHPRTRKSLETSSIRTEPDSKLNFIDPVGYLDMIQLEANAALIFTDSGGVQKEAYFAGVPCVTLRNETEWVETVEAGVNFLAGAQTDSILAAFERARTVDVQLKAGLYGDGHASEAILDIILKMT